MRNIAQKVVQLYALMMRKSLQHKFLREMAQILRKKNAIPRKPYFKDNVQIPRINLKF